MTTNRELEAMFGRVYRDAKALNLVRPVADGSDAWYLQTGSKTYGNAYTMQTDPGHFIRLGMTRNEAYASLYAMAQAFELVRENEARASADE
jgi:hypothetical protein